jgi:PTS system mannose-specific IIA component
MTQGLIITHGTYGKELVEVAGRILGVPPGIEAISMDWGGDGSDVREQVERFLRKSRGKRVLIFTDMFGGSPSNVAIRFVAPEVDVISGINLPGLLKFICYQDKDIPFRELVSAVRHGILDGITVISEYLGEKK